MSAPLAAADGAASRSPRGIRLRERALGHLWAGLLRVQAASWRVVAEGLDRLDRSLTGEPAIAVFWHGKYLPLFALLRGRRAVIFTSLSRRGDVIAVICRAFGYRPVQIADRGGEGSLATMREALAHETLAAIVVDGPLGPRHVVKPGAVRLAAETGRPLLPISTAARRSRVDRRRWDLMETPRAFTTVAVVVGEPLVVPAELSEAERGDWGGRVADALAAAERRAAALVAAGRKR